MREILFRGKRKDGGKWVEGHYSFANWYIPPSRDVVDTTYYILQIGHGDADEIDPETVGQFTGYIDKNGKKIFEGDVFHFEDDIIAVVVFRDGGFKLEEYGLRGAYTESGYDECGGGWGVLDSSPIDWYSLFDLEVIGNIYDNKDILEGKNVFL